MIQCIAEKLQVHGSPVFDSEAIAVGRPVARTAPAQIPACRFLAPGSSRALASVADNPKKKLSFGIRVAVAGSEVGIA